MAAQADPARIPVCTRASRGDIRDHSGSPDCHTRPEKAVTRA